MNKKGFTLIELLVVIAIIGILSSVAIVYLQDARGKANDAKVQSNIATASTNFEIRRANGEITDATTANAVASEIKTALGNHPCGTGAPVTDWGFAPSTDGSNGAWAAKLCSSGKSTAFFCADTSGFRGEVTSTPTRAGFCQ